ncbi:MAG TPA: hypothetical protein VFT06_03415 [Flavisolibacter sp.]|nr:hypothetical protein [Flavisolibacter sp.]
MKSCIPLLTFAVLLTSCSSVYKSGQTPDDVYFSPERQRDEYVRVEKNDDRLYGNRDRYEDYTLEDHYLRMKTRNRRYAFLESDIDCYCYGNNYSRYYDYNRMNNSYAYYNNLGLGWNYGYNNAYYYNPYYKNPYYSGVVYGNVNPVYNKPRKSNLHVFDGNGNTYNPNLPKSNGRTFSTTSGDENYRSSGTNAGGFLRNIFSSGSSSSSSTSNTAPTSTNSGSNSSSSSSSSSGSSRAPVRKF